VSARSGGEAEPSVPQQYRPYRRSLPPALCLLPSVSLDAPPRRGTLTGMETGKGSIPDIAEFSRLRLDFTLRGPRPAGPQILLDQHGSTGPSPSQDSSRHGFSSR
jgi:hypothetical protein